MFFQCCFSLVLTSHPCFGVWVWIEATVLKGYEMVVSIMSLAQSATEIVEVLVEPLTIHFQP